jgi:hypothetical protein
VEYKQTDPKKDSSALFKSPKKLRGLEPGRRKDLLLAETSDHQVQTSLRTEHYLFVSVIKRFNFVNIVSMHLNFHCLFGIQLCLAGDDCFGKNMDENVLNVKYTFHINLIFKLIFCSKIISDMQVT